MLRCTLLPVVRPCHFTGYISLSYMQFASKAIVVVWLLALAIASTNGDVGELERAQQPLSPHEFHSVCAKIAKNISSASSVYYPGM
jgi:hypothetical protein